ncbi:uncharacterized protein LOC112552367 [Pogonomyrmex barbatus]|uniref:Uncharacterized protein LOC112552367 n=1 Tax=Pogonomyrmex barbatus TaxID=144034 RepID=A0A8N1S580_9HYME|nr:uncharacterized protein LOC112552367 [Pogonomyrmex barbatus]
MLQPWHQPWLEILLGECSVPRGSDGVAPVAFTLGRLRNWFSGHLREADSDDLNGTLQSNEMKEKERANTPSRNVSLAEDERVSIFASLMLRSRPVRFVAPGSFIRALARRNISNEGLPNSDNPF